MPIEREIHYCWFGNGPMPEKEKACIETWKKYFPEYKLRLWNESNFDYKSCAFARQAYENKKYAFVSDYARTKVLYEYGGLYLDTDVEVRKNFEEYFDCECLLGFEGHIKVGTAVIYACSHNELMKKLLNHYETHQFSDSKGNLDTTANTVLLTNFLLEQGFKQDGQEQWIGTTHVLPRDVFYPKKKEEVFQVTSNTVAIHKFSANWLSERELKRGNNPFWINVMRPLLRNCRKFGKRVVGAEKIHKIEIWVRNWLR